MKNLSLSKDYRKRVKRQAQALRGCLQHMYLRLILQICKKNADRLVWRKHYNEKWVNDLNRHFTEAGIQMASTHMKRNLIQLCLTLCNPMVQWTLAGQAPLSMRILQPRILAWFAMSSSRGSSLPRNWTCRPRDQTCVSCIAGRFFTIWATREAKKMVDTRWSENSSYWFRCIHIPFCLLFVPELKFEIQAIKKEVSMHEIREQLWL